MSKGPRIPDRQTAIVAGVALILVGSYCLYDAFDARGRSRPFLLRMLPA